MTARAFSLLEMMVVVAILGIIAALAVPNLLPSVQIAAVQAAGHAVGGFVTQARIAAMSERRCTRVRILSATRPPILVSERLNSFDCEDPTTAPLIFPGEPLWIETNRLRLERDPLVLALAPAPSDTPSEIRFRPSGRSYSADGDLADDDAVITVTHPQLTAGPNVVRTVVDGPGPICTLARGAQPIGSGNTLSCP
jgi:prepilin-type N-terminal cleavage/methylation domain-containing protein